MNWVKFLHKAPDDEKLCFIKVFTEYVLYEKEPDEQEMTGGVSLAWDAMKSRIDKDRNIYERNLGNGAKNPNRGAPKGNKNAVRNKGFTWLRSDLQLIAETWQELSGQNVSVNDFNEEEEAQVREAIEEIVCHYNLTIRGVLENALDDARKSSNPIRFLFDAQRRYRQYL
jgi:hypothetical protein